IMEERDSVALVGHTGSGKATVTNLLMRFYDIQKGHSFLDGVDLRDWDLHDLRSSFAVVLQDVFLFSGTVGVNIRLGDKTISRDRVEWAAKEVHAHDLDRKSTRLNSSHVKISYAVFCLKKKK